MKAIISATVLVSAVLSVVSQTVPKSTDKGMNMILFNHKDSRLYLSLDTTDTTKMKGTMTFLTTKTVSAIEATGTGVYGSFGIGSTKMDKSDMVVCQYLTNKKYNCVDYYSQGHTIAQDSVLGGTDDCKLISGNIAAVTDKALSPYQTAITWEFTKDYNSNDAYDWSNIKNYPTAKGPIIGAVGDNSKSGKALEHYYYSNSVAMGNGVGFGNGGATPPPAQSSEHSMKSTKEVEVSYGAGGASSFLKFATIIMTLSIILLLI